MLNHTFFDQMLRQADPEKLAHHSVLNHHANGMDYLCLHRTPELTVKVYVIEEPENTNDGWLVNPHSHRYDFGTVVLAGALEHIRFKHRGANDLGKRHDMFAYEPGTTPVKVGETCLEWDFERYSVKDTYWVNVHEHHTLRMIEREDGAAHKPVVLGLIQLLDTMPKSQLLLPTGGEMRRPDSRVPKTAEYRQRVRRVQDLIQEFCS